MLEKMSLGGQIVVIFTPAFCPIPGMIAYAPCESLGSSLAGLMRWGGRSWATQERRLRLLHLGHRVAFVCGNGFRPLADASCHEHTFLARAY